MTGMLGVLVAFLFTRVALRAICMIGVTMAEATPSGSLVMEEPEPIDAPQTDEDYPTCLRCGHIGPDVYIVDKKCVDCSDRDIEKST